MPFIVVFESTKVRISDALPLITETFISERKDSQNCLRYVDAPTATGSNTMGVPC